MRMLEGGFFFDGGWLSNWTQKNEDETIALYAKEAERIYKETDYATNFVGYSHGGGFGGYFGGIDHAVNMTLNPEEEREKLLQAADRQIEHFKKVNKAFGKYIQLLTVGSGKPAAAYWIAQTFNAIWTLGIVWLLWSGVFFTPAILPD